MPSHRLRALLVALPALSLAAAGLLHPHHLTHATSQRWFLLHVAGLVVFPLVGLALASLVQGRRDAIAWAVRVTAYAYATFYTALDVVSGLAAGYVTRELGPGVPRPEEVRLLFAIGTPLGEVGSVALLACCALLAVDALRRRGRAAWPGLLLPPGAWLVHTDHIFSPLGVLGMALIGIGSALLVEKSVVTTTRSDATFHGSTAS